MCEFKSSLESEAQKANDIFMVEIFSEMRWAQRRNFTKAQLDEVWGCQKDDNCCGFLVSSVQLWQPQSVSVIKTATHVTMSLILSFTHQAMMLQRLLLSFEVVFYSLFYSTHVAHNKFISFFIILKVIHYHVRVSHCKWCNQFSLQSWISSAYVSAI